MKSLRKRFQDKLAHANSTAEESISNMVTVRSFSNEPKMRDHYAVDIDDSYRLGRKLAILSGKSTQLLLDCKRVACILLYTVVYCGIL